jgi:hypothetical protein
MGVRLDAEEAIVLQTFVSFSPEPTSFSPEPTATGSFNPEPTATGFDAPRAPSPLAPG